MQLRPLLSHVYARDREDYLPAELEESLLDAELEHYSPLRRAYLADTAAALLEDAVARLRAKSQEAARMEPPPAAGAPQDAASWRAREASWTVAAVLRAVAMPRDEAALPNDVYWAAVLVDACETGVKEGAARRLVGAAVLRRLAAHEDMLDRWIAQMRGRGGPAGAPTILQSLAQRPQPQDILGAMQRGALDYAPPDPRRLDPELVLAARATLADNLRALDTNNPLIGNNPNASIPPIAGTAPRPSPYTLAPAAAATPPASASAPSSSYNARLQELLLQGSRPERSTTTPSAMPTVPAAAPSAMPTVPAAAPSAMPAAPAAAPSAMPVAPAAAPSAMPTAPAAAPSAMPTAPAAAPSAMPAAAAPLPAELKDLVEAVA